jgi:hypothetical protein
MVLGLGRSARRAPRSRRRWSRIWAEKFAVLPGTYRRQAIAFPLAQQTRPAGDRPLDDAYRGYRPRCRPDRRAMPSSITPRSSFGLVVKPFTCAALAAKVRSVLEGRWRRSRCRPSL